MMSFSVLAALVGFLRNNTTWLKKNTYRLSVLFLLGFLLPTSLSAQWEVGATLGTLHYTGDLAPQIRPLDARPALSGWVKYNFSPTFGLQASLLGGKLHADERESDDNFQAIRGSAFDADVIEIAIRMEYNFRNFRALSETKRLSPYLFLGAGASRWQTKTNYSNNAQITQGLVLPYGLGIRYALPYGWNIGAEFGARFTFTDQIDGFASDANLPKFQFFNPENNDIYYFFGISLAYSFDRVLCPQRFKKGY
ncbi:DUF6089 family protein [Hugenholtzia roseola]|uniref:type IX secretion system protein PorG n=1 Tax=Hugenholtzia roseola TaxID=1002 RepID=UPI000414D88F|nr:DUF6089 family protein [Hugenholtzia roseola]